MSNSSSVKSRSSNPRSYLLIMAAIAFWVAIPFLVDLASTRIQAQATTPASLTANLTGPAINNMIPVGFAAYFGAVPGTTNAGRQLAVNVNNVNFPGGSQLGVFLNNARVGTIVLDPMKHGSLFLNTNNGGTVPMVVAGDTLSVAAPAPAGTTTIVLTGTFSTPPPSPTATHTPPPSPSPTGTPVPPVHFFAPLTGPAIGGVLPRGLGQYDAGNMGRHFEVFVSMVNLPEGTTLVVGIPAATAGTSGPVGTITLHNHEGLLRLDTMHGDTVPVVTNGTPIVVRNGNTVVLSGVFGTPPPPVTPSPTPSPTGTPVPPPAGVFNAHLNGASEVPPVMTHARGMGFVILNAAETQIRAGVGFRGLTSAPTAVTINGPAMPGETGPVIFTLAPPNTPTPSIGQVFTVTAEQATQLRTGLWYFNVATVNNPTGEIRGQIRSVNHRSDFDGDGMSEIGVIRSVDGLAPDNAANIWYTANSSGTFSEVAIGHPGDLSVQGDYDGDGTADIAMFTPTDGTWQIRGSATGETRNYHFGISGDIPVVGDYDGDGINDLAVFRPDAGNWYVLQSTDGQMMVNHWGLAGDRPVSGDFDGDGLNDLAVYRPSDGTWYILRSSDGGYTIEQWGRATDRPVAGDFDGDGAADIAVFRPDEGNWYIRTSSDGRFTVTRFGMAGDIPVPCEFDGDGTTDIAVFRPSDGNWYINRSSDQTMGVYRFGLSTDRPITTTYAP